MKETIKKVMRLPWVAHLLSAWERFNKRLGPQFAGAVTYFSVLSMIPVLMFAVALIGVTVTVLRPDLLPQVQSYLTNLLGGAATGLEGGSNSGAANLAKEINEFVAGIFNSWATIGLTALAAAAYSGSNWVKHLKHAVSVMWQEDFVQAAKKGNFLTELFSNLLIFFGLLLSVGLAVVVTAAGQAFPEQIIEWIGAGDIPGIGVILTVVGLGVSLLASWLLFAFLFVVLPGEATRPATFFKVSVTGAVLVTALQRLAGQLVGVLSGNASAGVFGPIIILMIVFNLLATVILLLAAWVGTADEWESARDKKDAEEAARAAEPVLTEDEPYSSDEDAGASPVTLAARRRARRWAANIEFDDLLASNYDRDTAVLEDPDAIVSQDVAARGARVGLGVGYAVGAATGIGVGAAIVAILSKFVRR